MRPAYQLPASRRPQGDLRLLVTIVSLISVVHRPPHHGNHQQQKRDSNVTSSVASSAPSTKCASSPVSPSPSTNSAVSSTEKIHKSDCDKEVNTNNYTKLPLSSSQRGTQNRQPFSHHVSPSPQICTNVMPSPQS
jgi:hypothetical protein